MKNSDRVFIHKMYLSLAEIDPAKFIFLSRKFTTECGMTCKTLLSGMSVGDGCYHHHVSFNKFEHIPQPIPEGYESDQRPDDEWIRKYFWNPVAQMVTPQRVPEYDQEHYFTHDNGGRPFVVYLANNTATVYTIPSDEDNQYYDEDCGYSDTHRMVYTKMVYQSSYQQVFIGHSPFDNFTEWSGGHGPKFLGNSILLHLSDLSYVFIGEMIKSFTSRAPIVYYQSSVGNNDVPYPYAIDRDGRCYVMLDDVIFTPQTNQHPITEYYKLDSKDGVEKIISTVIRKRMW